jgi:hypothetical protein
MIHRHTTLCSVSVLTLLKPTVPRSTAQSSVKDILKIEEVWMQ